MLTKPIRPTAHTSLYEKALGILIWLAFAAVGIGALYAYSKLAGD
jgi:amino acid permease